MKSIAKKNPGIRLKPLILTTDKSRGVWNNRFEENERLVHARMRRKRQKQKHMKKQKD